MPFHFLTEAQIGSVIPSQSMPNLPVSDVSRVLFLTFNESICLSVCLSVCPSVGLAGCLYMSCLRPKDARLWVQSRSFPFIPSTIVVNIWYYIHNSIIHFIQSFLTVVIPFRSRLFVHSIMRPIFYILVHSFMSLFIHSLFHSFIHSFISDLPSSLCFNRPLHQHFPSSIDRIQTYAANL